MLFLFRTNQFLLSIFLIIYAIILRYAFFINEHIENALPKGILSEWTYHTIDPKSTLAGVISIILIAIQAIIINQMINEFRMAKQITLFPGLFYILFGSFGIGLLPFSSGLIANTFILMGIFQLMRVYKEHSAAGNIFNVGFLISISSLFHFGYFIFILLALFGLNILRGFRFKEIIILLFGLLTPYYLMGVYAYWNDFLPLFYEQQFSHVGFLDFDIQWNYNTIASFSLFGILGVIALINFSKYNLSKRMHARKNIEIIFLAIIFTILMIFLQKNITVDDLITLAPYLGILLSFNFVNMDRSWAELFHGIIFIGALVLQYLYLFGY